MVPAVKGWILVDVDTIKGGQAVMAAAARTQEASASDFDVSKAGEIIL